ncbi:MAG: spermine synthase [Gammaproteobacteria bacterium HGW-Gammaproteobacteria-1]|jgi:spermidine synthase|nr:MAG: spermine synthase [Gammaproteobacteria bacterium HGW-Gammaproteobacteria-1]
MYKYGGVVIHQDRDELGSLEVVEDGYQRSLHFGSEPKQSSMDLHNPLRLALTYTRAMMSALLFNPTPRKVLLLGLGGGSLAKFLLYHFPACRIDAVEYRASVHRLARDFFQLPDDPRLTLHFADAADFIRQADAGYSDYDLVLVDAFTADGVAQETCGLSFFEACRTRLAAGGVLAANLWSGDRIRLDDIINDLGDAFDGRLLRLPVEGKANVIALVMQQGKPRRELRRLDPLARDLQKALDLEFASFLNTLRKNNRYFGL